MMNDNNINSYIVNDKSFDLYTHMKINIKCSSVICEIHDSNFTFYCLSCKRAICDICKTSYHSTHLIQLMSSINFENKDLQNKFKKIEQKIFNTLLFKNPEACKNQIKDKIKNEFFEIEKSLHELKEIKLEEADALFRSTTYTSSITENVTLASNMLNDYIQKYGNFYYDKEVKDEDNIIFLQTYDLFNTVDLALEEYENIIDEIKEFFDTFQNCDKSQYNKINTLVSQIKEEEKKQSLNYKNIIVTSKEEFNENSVLEADWGHNPANKLFTYFDRLKEDMFKDSKDKIKKSSELVDSFKKSVYDSFKKSGSLIDIEKTVKLFDEKTNKRTNFIKGRANLKFSPSQAKAYSVTSSIPQSVDKLIDDENNSTNKDALLSTNSKNEFENNSEIKNINNKKNSLLINNNINNKIIVNKVANKSLLNKLGNVNSEIEELDSLEEKDEDQDSENALDKSKEQQLNNNSNFFVNDDEDEINLENGYYKGENYKLNKEMQKLKKMFLPKKKEKKALIKPRFEHRYNNNNDNLQNNKDKFKINNKLHEIIQENQRLVGMIKKSDDINLVVSTIRRYYSYAVLEFVRKTFFSSCNNKSLMSSNNLLFDNKKEKYLNDVNNYNSSKSNYNYNHNMKDNIKVLEGTNQIQIYCRDKRKLVKKTIPFNKNIHSISVFPIGCRSYISRDKLYITGGKDSKSNSDLKIFFAYDFKENKVVKLPDMKKERSYHTMVFHENIKSILVFGGENNKTCEIFDIFMNIWNELPELNVPRNNINIYIDKIGTFAYAFCGSTGSISNGLHSDVIELLDLVDLNQGWAKVDYNNKALVDLKFSYNGIYPLTDDKLLIYGAKESRKAHKTFVIFDLRKFDLLNVDNNYLDYLRKQASKNPELSKILLG